MTREERREAMPIVTAFLDDIRKHLREPVSIKASENGQTIEWRKPVKTREVA